jgi:hypothetical protein
MPEMASGRDLIASCVSMSPCENLHVRRQPVRMRGRKAEAEAPKRKRGRPRKSPT